MRAARSKWLAATGIVILALVIGAVAARGPLVRFIASQIVGSATGTKVSFASIAFNHGHATVSGTQLTAHNGEQLAYIPRIDIAYRLRDLLPGSSHRFGLQSVTIWNPRVTIIHNPDGTYNLPKLSKGGPTNPQTAPLNMTLRVVNGTIAVIDNTRVEPSARRLSLANVAFDASIHTAARTRYVSTMSFLGADASYPIRGAGVIDAPAGFTLHHWTAARIALPQLVNYALNNATLRLTGGYLDNVDARYYGNFAATAYLREGTIEMHGLASPIRNVHGPLDMTSAGISTTGIAASIGGAPVTLRGGVYDLRAPKFRLTMSASGDLARLKRLATAASKLPISGVVDMGMLVEGPVRTPLAMIALHSPQLVYRAMPLRDSEASFIFDGKSANVLHAAVRYGPFDVAARGRMALQNGPGAVAALASISGPSASVPYASSLLPDMPLHAMLFATGNDLKKLSTQGVLRGKGASSALAAQFAVTSNGVGNVDVALTPSMLTARVAIDHPHNRLSAVVHASDLKIHPAVLATLPGMRVTSAPPVSGTVNGDVFAAQQQGLLGLTGAVTLRDAHYASLSIAQAGARFGGSPGAINVSSLTARGSFGSLDARGTITGRNTLALQGHLRGNLAELGGGRFPAHGDIDAPLAIVYTGGKTIAQIAQAQFRSASVRGVALDTLSATVAAAGRDLRVYAAHATIAHSASALASGSLGTKNNDLALSVAHLDLSQMHAGLPVEAGYADVGASASGALTSMRVNGAAVLDRARFGRYPVDANAAFAYAGDRMAVDDAVIGAGPALITLDGNVAGLPIGMPMHPEYDLNATLAAADAHALAQMAQPKLAKQDIEGSIDARVRITGSGRTPYVAGSFSVPEGSVHGLAFRDLHGVLHGSAQNVVIANAGVTVGTTALGFSATASRGAMRASLAAPRADLADFNDYFNTGDTLAGTGSLALDIVNAGQAIATSGNVDLGGVRYRRFDVGDANARWRTTGRTLVLRADVGGNAGRAHVAGTVGLPQGGAPSQLLTQSDLNITAAVRGVELTTWLPMLGMTAPIAGTLDADASAHGRYPDVSLRADANVADGVVGRVQVQQAAVSLSATQGRGTIRSAVVRIPYLSATGSGSFGLHRDDRLALVLHAASPDIGRLLATATGRSFNGTGTLDTTMRVGGTRESPQIADDFTLTSLRYQRFAIPKVWGRLSGNPRTIALEHGEVDFKRGRVLAVSGNAPLHLARNAPVTLDLALDNVDFGDFQSALPSGYRLAGTMGGAMHVRGTADAPQLTGTIALHNGYFVGPIDQNPVQKINGNLVFAGNTVSVPSLSADVGGGTMQLSARAVVPNFRSPRAATFTSRIIARGAQINSPKYFRGKIDASVNAFRNAGGVPTLTGSVEIPSARIPLTAFWNPRSTKSPTKAALPLAFDLQAGVGNDVRVQSTGVDVGAQGRVHVAGTLASPTLAGAFTSTGGTITFMRRFTINQASVAFSPSNGIMPTVDAIATTQVSNPVTYIALHVTGLAPNNLNIAFDSDPPYSRTQILALLSGVGNFNGTGGTTLASGGQNTIANLATGELNTLFTQQLLEPLSASLGNALGLANLQLTDDFTSGFGISAAKAFGKHITAVYSANLGTPQRRSLSIEAHRSNSTSFALVFYSVDSPSLLGANTQTNLFGFNDLANTNVLTPLVGSNGYSLMYEHKFQ